MHISPKGVQNYDQIMQKMALQTHPNLTPWGSSTSHIYFEYYIAYIRMEHSMPLQI